jgi:hypothetical protein
MDETYIKVKGKWVYDIAELWDNIAFEGKQDSVIEALKIIEKELSDLLMCGAY